MNIAFVVLAASFGGHSRTAVTIARALEKRGHKLTFITGEGCNPGVIEAAGFEMKMVAKDWLGRWANLDGTVSQIVREYNIDLVHGFDLAPAELVQACKKIGVPFAYTRCGGWAPPSFPPIRPLIVLSEELRDGMVPITGLKHEEISVIPARVDVSASRKPADPNVAADFKRKYGIPDESRIVLRVARLSPELENGIIQGMDAVAGLFQKGIDVRFVHIGYSYLDLSRRRVHARVDEINKACGATVAVSAQDEAADGAAYVDMADIVLGTGRSAFEAMIMGKPALVVGDRGFAGAVKPETVDAIAYYNFSGRNVKATLDYNASVTQTAEELERLLLDDEYRRQVGEFGRSYVFDELNADTAAQEYEKLYEQFRPEYYLTDEQIARHAVPLRAFVKERLINRRARMAIAECIRSVRRRFSGSSGRRANSSAGSQEAP